MKQCCPLRSVYSVYSDMKTKSLFIIIISLIKYDKSVSEHLSLLINCLPVKLKTTSTELNKIYLISLVI